jgi:hypothetical protein
MTENALKDLADFFNSTRVRGCKNRDCSSNLEDECFVRLIVLNENGKCTSFAPSENIKDSSNR